MESDASGHASPASGKQTKTDYSATRQAMAQGVEFIHQASLCNGAMRGSVDLLRRIDRPSLLGEWSDISMACTFASKAKTTCAVAGQTLEGTAQGNPFFCAQFCQGPMDVQVPGNQSQPALLRQMGIALAHGCTGWVDLVER